MNTNDEINYQFINSVPIFEREGPATMKTLTHFGRCHSASEHANIASPTSIHKNGLRGTHAPDLVSHPRRNDHSKVHFPHPYKYCERMSACVRASERECASALMFCGLHALKTCIVYETHACYDTRCNALKPAQTDSPITRSWHRP